MPSPSRTGRAQPRRWRAAVWSACTLLVAVPLLATAPAQADPISDVKAQIASTQASLDSLRTKSEVASEAYNSAVIKLGWADDVAKSADKRLADANATVAGLKRQAGVFAAQAYRSNGLSYLEIIASPSGPQDIVDRADALAAVSRWQRDTMTSLLAAQKEQQQAKRSADAAAAQQRKITAQLRSQRDQLVADAQNTETLLGQLQTKEQELVKAAQEAAARAAAARKAAEEAAARLAAQQAAAAAAAAAAAKAAAAAAAAAVAKQQAQPPAAPPAARTSPSGSASGGTSTTSSTTSRPVTTTSKAAPSPTTSSPPPDPTVVAPPAGQTAAQTRAIAVRVALAQVGKPYVFNTAGPDTFDCSGLTMFAYAAAGIQLAHYTGLQVQEGRQISQSQLVPGDLVFFGADYHHVGMYVGSGNMVDAPFTGAFVRVEGVWWSDATAFVRVVG